MINTNGRALIDDCKTTEMCVEIGRIRGDANLGDFTCDANNGQSTNYFLVHSTFLTSGVKFKVWDFDPKLLYVHHPSTMGRSTG